MIPYDADAEQIILANCLLSETAAPLDGLTEAHFWSESNRRVMQAIRSLADGGKPVNLVEVAAWLHANGNSVPASYVSSLLDGVPQLTPQTLPHYSGRLNVACDKRSVQREASQLATDAAGGGISVEEIGARAAHLAEQAKPKVPERKAKRLYPDIPRKAWTLPVAQYCDAVGESTEAADAYHYASFYTVVGSLLGRTVYTRKGRTTYPNLFTVLVGRSGARKGTAMSRAVEFLDDIDPRVYVLSSFDTRQGYAFECAAHQRELKAQAVNFEHRELLQLEEFRSLIEQMRKKETQDIPAALCKLYDCPRSYANRSKSGQETKDVIEAPTFNILGGTSYTYLENLSLADIEGGLGNRICWIPGDPKPRKDDPPDPDNSLLAPLKIKVREVIEDYRERETTRFHLSSMAGKRFKKYYLEEYSPLCNDEVIKVLSERDDQTCLKLATINAALDHSDGQIEEQHLEPAIAFVQWLWEVRFPVFAGHGLSPAAQTDQKIVEKVRDSGAGGISYRNLQKSLHRVDAETFHRRMKALTAEDSALRVRYYGKKRWIEVNEG